MMATTSIYKKKLKKVAFKLLIPQNKETSDFSVYIHFYTSFLIIFDGVNTFTHTLSLTLYVKQE